MRPAPQSLARNLSNLVFLAFCWAATAVALIALAAILWTLVREGVGGLEIEVFTKSTPAPGSEGGLLNAIAGSIMMCALAMVGAVVFGVLAGTWLAEYARNSRYGAVVRFLNDVLLSAPSILVGLVDSCAHNRRRERRDIRLFETGSRFISSGENRAVGLAWCGAADGAHWSAPVRAVDFFDAKGVVEQLLDAFGIQAATLPVVRPYLSPERSAAVQTADGERVLGVVGRLLPAVAEARGFPSGEELFVAELDLDAIAALARTDDLRVESLPRFPSIARDISILVDETLGAAEVRQTIRASAPQTLVRVREFDRYLGKGVPEGKVSLSLRLTFRSADRTLTDAEVQKAMDDVLSALREKHNVVQR